ncbi:MAG: glycosyltransferase family 4 protein, partial [Thaumarchaeota archaeon]|nr:glycosyltransferase family 4 protein [Nitrososphaerota archaeon]
MENNPKQRLRILMLSWEYPPRIVGGISRVVEGLSRSLTELGHEVHVITNEMPGSSFEDNDRGVIVHRVRIETPTPTFQTWVMMMNHYFSKRAGRLAKETGAFDIVHVHDWLVLPCGAEIKTFLETTMVSTLHSLEFRRSSGVTTPESKMVDSLEWWITYESSVVIVCSESMKIDARNQFQLPEKKVRVIPIGIDPDKFNGIHPNRERVRQRHGVFPGEKLVLFVGRLTHQKGCEYLIRAIPYVSRFFDVKL